MVLNARTDPSWDNRTTLNSQHDDYSIPPKAWVLMRELDPDFLRRFVHARNKIKW